MTYHGQSEFFMNNPTAREILAASTMSDMGHATFDAIGMIPVFGEVADGINALWYLGEGDYVQAGLSAGAMIPIVGDLAFKGGKYAAKAYKTYKYAKRLEAATAALSKLEHSAENAGALAKMARNANPHDVAKALESMAPMSGFESFAAFKKAMGPAGSGKAWHHIVEQTASNVEKFGAEAIHNTSNLIKLPHGAGTIHAKISGYYSSVQRFTEGKTVRKWLSGKSFQEQYEFGIKTLKVFAKGSK